MKARDIMVSPVVTVKPDSTVKDVAKLLLERRISAAPVVDDQGKLVGMISEGDLIHRAEIGTQERPSWWLLLVAEDSALASDYIKSHSRSVADLMTRNVITAGPDTPVSEIARLLEKNAIKRVPIVQDGRVVGIVSRANLLQAIATSGDKLETPVSDQDIREQLLAHLKAQPWAHTGLLNATVSAGVVDLWGITSSETERKAVKVAAETMPGVKTVNDHLTVYRRPSMQ